MEPGLAVPQRHRRGTRSLRGIGGVRRRATLAVCMVLALAGGNRPAVAGDGYVELLHLWAVEEERHALDAIAASVRGKGVEFQEHVSTTNFTGIKSILTERLALGVPPTVVQWIGGREDVLALYDAGVFKLVSDDSRGPGGIDRLRPEIAEIISVEGGLLLLPTGIHLQNHVAYNQKILDEIGAAIPSDWEAFIKAAQMARDAGYFGIALSDERWQLRHLMHGLLVADLSRDEFESLFTDYDEDGFDMRKVEASFARLRTLQGLANPDNADLPWASAVAHMTDDRAMASVIGDFQSTLFPAEGRFTCDLPPGNRYVLWAFDTFALVNVDDPAAVAGHRALLESVSDPAVQGQYIVRKGGVPAFLGVDPSSLNACSQRSVQIWDSGLPRVFLASRAWTQNMNVMANAAREFWRNPRMTPAEAADGLKKKLKALSVNEAR